MLTKYAIIDSINSGLLIMNDKHTPPTHLIFEDLFLKGSKIDWPAACDYLDTPEKTIRRWYLLKKFPAMAAKLLHIKYRGFLPYSQKWKNCYFDDDENIVTPYGVCKPSDLAFVHRYKWMGEQSRAELSALKQSKALIQQGLFADELNDKIQALQVLADKLTPYAPKKAAN